MLCQAAWVPMHAVAMLAMTTMQLLCPAMLHCIGMPRADGNRNDAAGHSGCWALGGHTHAKGSKLLGRFTW